MRTSLTDIKNRRRPMCENSGVKTTATTTAPAAVAPETKTDAFTDPRLNREWTTLAAMIEINCRDRHGTTAAQCAECRELLDYARRRLERCRFGAEKPTCARCPVHCYQRTRREQVKAVMRYAGPRMVWQHPVMSLRHWLDGFRPTPKI